MVVHLILTTLAGEETQLTIELQEYDRLYQFENAVLEQLPNIGESSTFGCELDFVRGPEISGPKRGERSKSSSHTRN